MFVHAHKTEAISPWDYIMDTFLDTKWTHFLITAIGLCSVLKMNQWLGSGAAQSMAGKPARKGGAYGYIMWAFAKALQVTFDFKQRLSRAAA